ncbi:MAG TPA: GntR family transcriptional regulator [Roseiarcus sp.]|nr:GntR family transcriptional regulator [Roseiarcus sp.]
MSEAETRRGSKADQVYNDLKEDILSGALEPGAAIDKLALCERLGVSRFPVSSAINRLAYERLVAIEPQHGSFVAKISVDDVRELMMVRRALEAEIAAQAAQRLPREGVEDLERNLRYQQAAVDARDFAGFYALDVEFHRLLTTHLEMVRTGEILDGLRSHLERVRRLLMTPPGRMPKTYAEHSAVAKAIARGDSEGARTAMRDHLAETTRLFENFAKDRPNLFSS